MRTLREILLADAKARVPNWEPEEEELQEWFSDEYEVVQRGETDTRRWHTAQECVVKVVDEGVIRYFSNYVCIHSGENSPEDAGFCPIPIDEVLEVFPKEVTTVKYVYAEEL